MFIPDCDNCEHSGCCAVLKSNKEMSEALWNIGREQSGRSDYILNGKYYPEEPLEEEA